MSQIMQPLDLNLGWGFAGPITANEMPRERPLFRRLLPSRSCPLFWQALSVPTLYLHDADSVAVVPWQFGYFPSLWADSCPSSTDWETLVPISTEWRFALRSALLASSLRFRLLFARVHAVESGYVCKRCIDQSLYLRRQSREGLGIGLMIVSLHCLS